MGGHGHGAPYEVPHYSTFKVEGCHRLEELQKALEKKGLKDPWIRNEAWRYSPGFGTRAGRVYGTFFRGLPVGLGLAIITTLIGKAAGGDGHGHDHH